MRGLADGFRDMPGSIAESEVGMRFDDSVAFAFRLLTSDLGTKKYEVRMKK